MATVGLTLATMSEVLKLKYTPQNLKLMGYHDNPLLAMLPKSEDFGGGDGHVAGATPANDGTGKGLPIPVWFGGDQGSGRTILLAQANQSATNVEEFIIKRSPNYAVHDISRQALKASVGREHSFLSGRAMLMDEAVYNLSRSISNDLYKGGASERGRIGALSSVDGTDDALTLQTTEDVVNFEVGMPIVSTTANDATYGTATGSGKIRKIDRGAGILYADDGSGGVGNWQTLLSGRTVDAGDYLFRSGDVGAAFASAKGIVGLGGWVPATAPASGENFLGVDRSFDKTRLGGLRHVGTSQTVAEAIIDAGTLCRREGVRPDLVICNPVQFAELAKDLQGKAVYEPVSSPDGVVSFESLKVRTGAGTIPVVDDYNCPVDKAYMLTLKTWKLYSLGPLIELVDEDGLVMMRKATADDYEMRWASYAGLGCHGPGQNCVITLAT